jgi:hypothetical protein
MHERARCREISCAVQKQHAFHVPDDPPYDQARLSLTPEPDPAAALVYLSNARLPVRRMIVPGLPEAYFSAFMPSFLDTRSHVSMHISQNAQATGRAPGPGGRNPRRQHPS